MSDESTKKTTEGKGVLRSLDGKNLILEVDLLQNFGLSSSKKTFIVGTTSGPKQIPGFPGFSVSLTVFRKPVSSVPEDFEKEDRKGNPKFYPSDKKKGKGKN